jgi:hypothetical protein
VGEIIKIIGDFEMDVFKIIDNEKILIEHYEDNNKVVTLGKDKLRKMLANDGTENYISKIAFGTDSTEPTIADTNLTDRFIKSIISYEYTDTTSIQFNWALVAGEANGMAIYEYGLFTEDTTLFARKVRTVINKEADIVLEGYWKITFI